MSAKVKILIEGYTNAGEVKDISKEKTQPTITLVRDGDLVIVVDPGILESQQMMVEALEKENLTVEDVNVVCITHSHLDHYRNIGMFPDAKTLEYFGLWEGILVQNWEEQFSKNIKVLHTPGHDYTGITLFVTTEKGVVAICGDVFWRDNYPESAHDDAYASNSEKLEESREMVLKIADWIVPGHGPMYKNEKSEEPDDSPSTDFQGSASGVTPSNEKLKITVVCKKCGRAMKQREKCQCRPYLCFRCCECGLDCDLCNCSHKK